MRNDTKLQALVMNLSKSIRSLEVRGAITEHLLRLVTSNNLSTAFFMFEKLDKELEHFAKETDRQVDIKLVCIRAYLRSK